MHRIAVENRGAADAEIAFDLLDQYPAEDVAPAIVVADANAGATRRASQRRRVRLAARQGRQQVDAGETLEGVSDRKPLERGKRVRRPAAKGQDLRPGRFRCQRQDGRTVAHQRVIRLARAIPLDHGEFRMVQRAPLAVAEHFGEFDDPALARRQELLAGKFWRGAQIEPARSAVRGHERRRESMQMGLITRRDLQRPGLDLDEVLRGKVAPQGRNDTVARQQERPAVGMHVRGPERRCGGGGGRRLRHNLVYENPRKLLAIRLRISMVRPELAQSRNSGNLFSDKGMRKVKETKATSSRNP